MWPVCVCKCIALYFDGLVPYICFQIAYNKSSNNVNNSTCKTYIHHYKGDGLHSMQWFG